MRAHNTTDLMTEYTLILIGFIFRGFTIFTDLPFLQIYHYCGFHIIKFADAGANGVEVFTGDVFTDVQSCIMQCLLHWCTGDSLTSGLYFSTRILLLCNCTIIGAGTQDYAGDLCPLML